MAVATKSSIKRRGVSGRRGRTDRRAKFQAKLFLEALEDRRLLNADGGCFANLFAGPRLASVDSQESELIEGVFNALLPGSHVDLTVADWNAIDDSNVNIKSFLTQLQADLTVSSPDEVLSAEVTMAQVFSALADVIPADGDTADLHAALFDLSGDTNVSELMGTIQLGNLLEVQFPDGMFANVDVNVLNLVTGVIELYNYKNVVTTADPVTLSGSVFNSPGIVDVELWAQVIEPPIIDPAIHEGTQFHSAAVRVKMDVDLVDFAAPLNTDVTITDMDLYVDASRAQGEVDLIDRITRAVDIKASHGLTNVYMGEISDSLFFNRTHVVNPLTDVEYGKIGSLDDGLQILDVEAKAWAEGTAPHATLLEFTGPYPESQTTGTSAVFVANAAHDLLTSMDVRTRLLGISVSDPTGDIRNIVDDAIHQPLVDAMSGVGDPVLEQLGTGIGEMDVTINNVFCPPRAVDDFATTNEDMPVAIDLPANDTDVDGDLDRGSVQVIAPPLNGSVTIDPNMGVATYTPDADFNGADTFMYTIRDLTGLVSNEALVTITVVPQSDNPVAVDDTYTGIEDKPITIAAPGVLSNDFDVDGDPLTSILVSNPSHGTVSFNSDGSFVYTAAPDFNGTDTFEYKANDGSLDSNTATVTLIIDPVNDPPVAVDNSYSTSEDTPLTIAPPGVLANDSDVDGDLLTSVLVSGPNNGSVTLNADGSFTYSPDPDYDGPDSFKYQANDGELNSNVATVRLTVNPVNDAPVAVDDSYSTKEETAITVAAPGVLGNDSDPDGDPLSSVLVNGPGNGTLSLDPDGSFNYTPGAGFSGTDTFTYQANDGQLNSNLGTVTIVVASVNDAPVAVNDSYTTDEDAPLIVAAPGVLGNDSDPDGDPLASHIVGNPSHGTVTLNDNGSFTYTPDDDYNGPDSFAYQANDGSADSNVATVSLTVNPLNDAPVAANDAYSTDEDTPLVVAAPGVLSNDSDVDGDPLTSILVSGPSNGTLSLNADGSFNYTPDHDYNGPDSFTYKANDSQADSNVATANITVVPVNDAPVALDDAYNMLQNSTLTVAAPGVQANDSDVDSASFNSLLVTGPSHGTLSLNEDGSFNYAPDHNFVGQDSFTYRNNDGSADSNVATVTIRVDPLVADLSLDKTVDNPTPFVGGKVTYTITIDNTGPASATGVTVNDILPPGTTFLSSSVSQGSYNSGSGTWTVGTLSEAGSATLQISARINTAGAKTNVVEVSASNAADPDSTPGNGDPAEDDRDSVTVMPSVAPAQITHTSTSVRDYLNGEGDDLNELRYGTNDGKIAHVAPGVFFYYVSIVAPSSTFTIFVDQRVNHASFSTEIGIHNDLIKLYDSTAERIFNFTKSHQNGDVTLDVNSATVGEVYTVRVKYDPHTVVEKDAPNPSTVGYQFVTEVGGSPVSQDNIDLVKKGQALRADSAGSLDVRGEHSQLVINQMALARGEFTVAVNIADARQIRQIHDAVEALNDSLAEYGTTLRIIDSASADITVTTGPSTELGGVERGILGFTTGRGDVTLVEGWNWYVGADPQAIARDQFDFQTVVTHELAHAVGLDDAYDANSLMHRQLQPGIAPRLNTADVGDPVVVTVLPESVDASVRQVFHLPETFAGLETAPAIATPALHSTPSRFHAPHSNGESGAPHPAGRDAAPLNLDPQREHRNQQEVQIPATLFAGLIDHTTRCPLTARAAWTWHVGPERTSAEGRAAGNVMLSGQPVHNTVPVSLERPQKPSLQELDASTESDLGEASTRQRDSAAQATLLDCFFAAFGGGAAVASVIAAVRRRVKSSAATKSDDLICGCDNRDYHDSADRVFGDNVFLSELSPR